MRYGYACHHYNANDAKFTTPYKWRHCVDMHVGETYEVHWPHSSLGACHTPWQYQEPFYNGVFCGMNRADGATRPAAVATAITAITTPGNLTQGAQAAIAGNVGVQGQVFTIINDEEYYYP